MSSSLHLVVAGHPALATALRDTGVFAGVHAIDNVPALAGLIKGGPLAGVGGRDLVLLVSDQLPTVSGAGAETLAAKAAKGFHVVVLAHTPKGRDLVASHPSCGLLEGDLTVNTVLGALAGMSGLNPTSGKVDIAPAEDGFAVIPSGWSVAAAAAPVVAEQPAAVAPRASAWGTEPAASAAPSGWDTAPAADPAARSGWQQPPAAESPAPAWGSSPQPSSPAPAWGAPPPVDTAGGAWGAANGDVRDTAAQPDPGLVQDGGDVWGTSSGTDAWGVQSAPSLPAGRTGAQWAAPLRRRGQVIGVTVPKGGAGKSTLTLNLAVHMGLRLRNSGKKVVIVDANFQQADIGKYLGVYDKTIVEVAKDPTLLNDIHQAVRHLPEYNVWLLNGPAIGAEAMPTVINADLYRSVVSALRREFDYILIDTPVAEKYHHLFQDFVLTECDDLAVILNPNFATVFNTDQWLREICRPRATGGDEFNAERIHLVLNRAEEDVNFSEETVRVELAAYRYVGAINESKVWRKAANQATPQVVAAQGYVDVNESLAQIVYGITGDQDLAPGAPAPSPAKQRKGLGARLRSALGR